MIWAGRGDTVDILNEALAKSSLWELFSYVQRDALRGPLLAYHEACKLVPCP